MKTFINFILLGIAISRVSDARDICQKVLMDGLLDGEDIPAVEEINQCYKCEGWSKVIEGQAVPAFLPTLDADATSGWSWCVDAESIEEDVYKVEYERPIKLAGFTITSRSPNTWVEEVTVSYEDSNSKVSKIKNIAGDTVFEANVDDHSTKENKFLLPVTTSNILIRIKSFKPQDLEQSEDRNRRKAGPCFNIRLYSCEKATGSKSGHNGDNTPHSDATGSKSGHNGDNTPHSDASVTNSNKCTINVTVDCPDVDCIRYLTDSDGCERCACDRVFTGTMEGDIIVDSLSREMIETEYGMRKDSENIQSAGIIGERYRWKDHRSGSNYVVPYILDGSLSTKSRQVISEAMTGISAISCIRFQSRTNQPNYLRFFVGGGCYSYVGNVRRGGQEVSIGNGCEYLGIVQHEILHALGFWHEQSRSDRDQYVDIFFENIQSGRENNFEKRNHQDYGSPYDYKSIMHYSNYAFSANGRATIQAKGNPNLSLGQRSGLTDKDKEELNRMYECSGSGTTTATTTTTPSACTNKDGDYNCEYWQGMGFCQGIYEEYMKINCAKSCEICVLGGGSCTDIKPNCSEKKQLCTSSNSKRRARILKKCQKTCNQC